MWLFLSKNNRSIAVYLFDYFDSNATGFLSLPEINDLVIYVYNSSNIGVHIKKIISSMEKNEAEKVSRDEFITSAYRFPALLFPAYDLQVNMTRLLNMFFFLLVMNEQSDIS